MFNLAFSSDMSTVRSTFLYSVLHIAEQLGQKDFDGKLLLCLIYDDIKEPFNHLTYVNI